MNVPGFDLPAQIKSIRPELDAAIARTLDSCAFCMGPEVVNFEGAFAKYVGIPHCLGFNSGTSALHVAMRLLDIGPGDEVITTPYTFIATSWAIAYVGAKPVYVDIEKETMNLDPRLIERAITPKTKAVMPVDLYGHPFDADAILDICRRHELPLVEDAAQAVGASYKGRSAGTLGEMAAFSFYPGKNLGACGEGGALVTATAAYAKRGAALREHGASTRYFHEEVGYNYRMEGFQGAVLGVKLPHLPAWTAARRRIAHTYHKLLASTPLARCPLRRQASRASITSTWCGTRTATSCGTTCRQRASAPRSTTLFRCTCRSASPTLATSRATFRSRRRPLASALACQCTPSCRMHRSSTLRP